MKKGKLRGLILGIVILTMVVPSICFAIGREVDPRDGFPGPQGIDVFLLYYRNGAATHYKANGHQVYNADVNATLTIARYVHYFGITEKLTWVFTVLQPYGYQQVRLPNDGSIYNQSTSGLGDTTLVTGGYYNWTKGPNFTAFTDLSFYLYLPVGEYDKNKAINLGANRYNLAISFAVWVMRFKNFTFEEMVGIDWFTKNDEYAVVKNLGQNVVYSNQVHMTYDITKAFWVGASWFYHNGGETQINGVPQKNSLNENKLMGTAALALTPATQLMMQYAWDASLDNGFPTRWIMFRFAYFW